VQLLVIAKEPRPGFVKTRLCPPCTPREAASIAAAGLADTLDVVRATSATRRVLALDGEAGPWLGSGVGVIPQVDGGLGARLDAAFAACFAASDEPVVLIGMDTPQVTPALLTQAGRAVERPGGPDAVLGLASDGGWWLLALRARRAGVFDGVPMSEDDTGARQLARLRELGLQVSLAPVLTDVDHAADAQVLASALPGSRFARAVEDALGSVA